MIAVYLIAAHLVGDFVLQTRWQAAGKFDSFDLRVRHVLAYCVPFVPIAIVYSADAGYAGAFMAWLYLLHFATDTRRFHSTLGEWIVWRTMPPGQRADELQTATMRRLAIGDYHTEPMLINLRPSDETAARARIPANPWTPIPILIDQTLHLCQLALLGGLLLR